MWIVDYGLGVWMKITFLTAGTGSYYCGACMRDNALAKALLRAGHEVEMLPMYLPLTLDEEVLETSRETPVFFGGINVYLQQKFPMFRRTPAWFDKLLNGVTLLKGAAARSHMTSAREHGEMALEMLRVEASPLGKEMDKLVDWLGAAPPDVLCLSNALQIGMLRQLKARLHGVKIICCFQGEDTFVDGLPEPYRGSCWGEMTERMPEADLLVAPSRFYADLMRERLGLPDLKIEVLWNGIDLEGYGAGPEEEGPPVVGYLARMSKEKGLVLLVEAFIKLRKDLGHPDAKLVVAGTATKENEALVWELQDRLDKEGLSGDVEWRSNISRREKEELLRKLTLFSVPVLYPEAFGLFVIEAMASGVPVVQPDAASFREIVAATKGGELVRPEDAGALAEAWMRLLDDRKALREMGERGRRAVEKTFSVDAMRDRFAVLAEQVLDADE
jgi:glycosyltransferase involved in cell wall biosynthesis